MWLKENLNSHPDINSIRYKSAKNIFILSALLFYMNYYFVWAWFYLTFFKKSLTFSYIIFVLCIFIYIYFFLKVKLFINKSTRFYYIIISILALLFIITLVPFLIDKKLIYG